MLKQFVQQGPWRAKRRGGTDRTSCGPFALVMDLSERRNTLVIPKSGNLFQYVEPLNEARTKLVDCFSILLDPTRKEQIYAAKD